MTDVVELAAEAGVAGLAELAELSRLVAGGGVVALTGAGISTDSGIPDYRGPNGSLRRHTPMTHQQFTADRAARRRYWARSHVGWRTVAEARPNAGHEALVQLERWGLVDGVVTQNVDGLHLAAGSKSVVELHGSLSRVRCAGCGEASSRAELDARLRAANPAFRGLADADTTPAEVNPDGDVSLGDALLAEFVMVGCGACGDELIEPDVVFFGATVPRERATLAAGLVDGARLLLVLGSSLQVMSGYRLVLRACERQIPVAIVNQGPTRGDARAAPRVSAPLGTALPALVRALA